MEAGMREVRQRARRRIAYRLLPFVFLIYIVNYIDGFEIVWTKQGRVTGGQQDGKTAGDEAD
jgi:hypothetical protein